VAGARSTGNWRRWQQRDSTVICLKWSFQSVELELENVAWHKA
jgi:hypothetical protein